MPAIELPKAFLDRIRAVTDKRPKAVIDHIIKHGSITTEELKELYGYNHAPRAARDVRENGIPLKTTMTKDSKGRRCGAYTFDLTIALDGEKIGGRKAFSKNIKDTLIQRDGSRCAVCGLEYSARYLQVDHCVPYEVAGESLSDDPDQLMLVCASCNRGKSWSCEHCLNWTELKKMKTCQTCYWASPHDYQHIALVQIRRVDIGWEGDEVEVYDKLRQKSKRQGVSVQELVKSILKGSPVLK
ncbi:MAG: HNH endonuclease [Candidatus Sulfotelmatobacter sp.]